MDLYLSDDNVYHRLVREWKEHKSLIVALDFDLTIYDFHKQDLKFDNVIGLVREGVELGFRVVIFTANKDYELILDYCKQIDLDIVGINKNLLPQFDGSGKIFYNIFLDDRAGLSASYKTLRRVVNAIKKEEI